MTVGAPVPRIIFRAGFVVCQVANAAGNATDVQMGAAGNYTAIASAVPTGGNLDVELDLLRRPGAIIAPADQTCGQSDGSTPSGLDASVRPASSRVRTTCGSTSSAAATR